MTSPKMARVAYRAPWTGLGRGPAAHTHQNLLEPAALCPLLLAHWAGPSQSPTSHFTLTSGSRGQKCPAQKPHLSPCRRASRTVWPWGPKPASGTGFDPPEKDHFTKGRRGQSRAGGGVVEAGLQ